MITPHNIAIVDDQLLFRQGLAALIADVPGFHLLLEAESAGDVLEKFEASPVLPHVLLMDMKLPDMNGTDLNAVLQKKYPSVKVIVVSMYDQERFIYRMIEGGACGYLVKNCGKEELVAAINSVLRTGFYFNNATMHAMRNAAAYQKQGMRNLNNIPIELSEREEEVLKLICREYTNTEIATELFISVRTAEGHRNKLLLKTGCKNSAGLVVFAIRHGLFDIMAG